MSIMYLFQKQKGIPEKKPNIGQELLNVPMGKMIREMAFAIADAQLELDSNSIRVAQMLGGLQQIENSKGEVTFEDSRVYFGKEKLKLADAIEIHNTTDDIEYRARVRQGLGIDNYEEINLDKTFYTSYDALTKATVKAGQIYKVTEKGTDEYYLCETIAPKEFRKVTRYHTTIKKKGNISENNFIYMPTRVSMLELGFTPTFYQFVDTIIEVKITITYTSETTNTETEEEKNKSARLGWGRGSVKTSQVNGSYSQKFNYSSEGSSLLRTKLVPIPPPAILEERIRALMEIAKEEGALNNPTSSEGAATPPAS